MDCVYHAYIDYLKWLDEPLSSREYLHWKILKWSTHGLRPQYTFGGVVPWIIENLSSKHNLSISLQRRIYTPKHYIEIARKYYPAHFQLIRKIIDSRTYFWSEVNKITLAPAIYLLLTGQHAVFSTQVPSIGVPVMAIQLQRR